MEPADGAVRGLTEDEVEVARTVGRALAAFEKPPRARPPDRDVLFHAHAVPRTVPARAAAGAHPGHWKLG